MINPFNITKAVDYSDEELNNFWVDFPKNGFHGTIKPTSEMPMIILGSKGSGKTHIMKHFSYSMQKLRHEEELLKNVLVEGYLGTYLRCSGLNGYKFSGKGETDQNWEVIFSYYLELWLGQLLLNNVNSFLQATGIMVKELELVNKIFDLFDKNTGSGSTDSIQAFTNYLGDLQKQIDFTINNHAFTRERISENIKILVSPGKLIFGIPEILAESIQEFKSLKFLYLLDEYENFTEGQQRYFNTLIRERRNPTCFKIGARRYGIRTKSTLSANEEIKVGSEYEEIDIDAIFRKNYKEYKEFLKNICLKRLNHSGFAIVSEKFTQYFESFCEQKLFLEVSSKGKNHIQKFRKDLKSYTSDASTEEIIENLKFDKDLILERTNIFLAYRAWKEGKDLLLESKFIKIECESYFENSGIVGLHGRILEKFKNDIIDALFRENYLPVESQIGFSNLVKMSNGIPRHFLIIMKHIFRWNEFIGKNIFHSTEEKISSKSQLMAVKDTASWFIEDAHIPGKNGNKMKDAIERLCDYLRELRYSDIPPECSISAFSLDSKVIPSEMVEMLNFLEQYSYIIKLDSGRRDKNFNNRNQTFQINGLIAVEWELALARRGIINLSFEEIKAIFSPNEEKEYKIMRRTKLAKYNAPFPSSKFNNPSLFD